MLIINFINRMHLYQDNDFFNSYVFVNNNTIPFCKSKNKYLF